MATKRKVKRFDEGGDARAGMSFAGTGSGIAGSGAADAAAGRGDADTGRNTGDASRGGGSQEGSAARAGDSFAGTGSGLGGTGVGYARSGIGGDGPTLGDRVGHYVSAAKFDKTTQKNNQAKKDFASLGLGLNNATQKYQLSNRRETDGTMVNDSFKNYTNPYAAKNEFNYQYDKLGKELGIAKGGKVKAYAKGGVVSSASSRGDGIAQRGKTKGRMC